MWDTTGKSVLVIVTVLRFILLNTWFGSFYAASIWTRIVTLMELTVPREEGMEEAYQKKKAESSRLQSVGRKGGKGGSLLCGGWNKGFFGKLNNAPVEKPGAERERAP